jgi:hypothetical protein
LPTTFVAVDITLATLANALFVACHLIAIAFTQVVAIPITIVVAVARPPPSLL